MHLLFHVLDFLSDGQYHRFDDLMTALKPHHPNATAVEVTLSFLAQFGFVDRIKRKRTRSLTWKVRLSARFVEFLHKVEEIEAEMAHRE